MVPASQVRGGFKSTLMGPAGLFFLLLISFKKKSQLPESVQDTEIHTRHLGGSGHCVKSSVSLLRPILPAPVSSPGFTG